MNKGMSKAGARQTYAALHRIRGLEDVWQLYRSAEAGDYNFSAQYVANMDASSSYWIRLTAHRDGSFSVTNQRTGNSTHYGPHSSLIP
jgi:hypothetical protein